MPRAIPNELIPSEQPIVRTMTHIPSRGEPASEFRPKPRVQNLEPEPTAEPGSLTELSVDMMSLDGVLNDKLSVIADIVMTLPYLVLDKLVREINSCGQSDESPLTKRTLANWADKRSAGGFEPEAPTVPVEPSPPEVSEQSPSKEVPPQQH